METSIDLKGISDLLGLITMVRGDHRVFQGPEYDALEMKLVQAADRMLGWVLSEQLSSAVERLAGESVERIGPYVVRQSPTTFGVEVAPPDAEAASLAATASAWVPPANVGQMPPTDLMGPQHQDFRQLFAGLGYDQIDSAMGKWQLPGLDSPYWASTETAEDRKAKFARVAAQGGPGGPKAQQATQWTPQPPQAAQAPWQGQQSQAGPACKKCGSTATRSSTVRKEGPNQGRAFRQCVQCNGFVAWGG